MVASMSDNSVTEPLARALALLDEFKGTQAPANAAAPAEPPAGSSSAEVAQAASAAAAAAAPAPASDAAHQQ